MGFLEFYFMNNIYIYIYIYIYVHSYININNKFIPEITQSTLQYLRSDPFTVALLILCTITQSLTIPRTLYHFRLLRWSTFHVGSMPLNSDDRCEFMNVHSYSHIDCRYPFQEGLSVLSLYILFSKLIICF